MGVGRHAQNSTPSRIWLKRGGRLQTGIWLNFGFTKLCTRLTILIFLSLQTAPIVYLLPSGLGPFWLFMYFVYLLDNAKLKIARCECLGDLWLPQ